MKDWLARRWARVPLAATAAGCCAGVLCAQAEWPFAWMAFPAVVMVVFGAWRDWKVAAGFAAWLCLWGIHGERIERQSMAEMWILANGRKTVEVEGTVLSLRDRSGFLPRAVFRVAQAERNAMELRGAVIGVQDVPDEVKPGDVLLLTGQTYLPRGARNPGEFDRLDWMRTRGMAGEIRATSHEIADLPEARLALHRFAWDLRREMRERIVAGLPEGQVGAVLIRGLVLGDRAGGAQYYGAFRKSGTMHVFAVSGLHVGLVGALGWLLMRIFRVPRMWGLWAVLVIMWSYAFVTGLRPPALRASLMASVFLLGFAFRREPSLGNSLLASMPIVLLFDSFQLQQAGFQLSYAVVGMIVLLAPFLYRRVAFLTVGDPFLPRVLYTRTQRYSLAGRKYVLGLLVVSVAAWMGSMPLIGHHFGIVTPAAVLASMVLVPIVFVMLSVALLGVGVGLISPPLEVVANQGNAAVAHLAYWVAEEFTELPGSHYELHGRDSWQQGILVFDLWSGDGAIYCGAGEGILIDGGDAEEFDRVIEGALRDAGAAPQSLALTHPDGGHVEGLARALEVYDSRQLLLPVERARSPGFRRLLQIAEAQQCSWALGEPARRYPLGDGAELEVLRIGDLEHGSRADDRCMIMRLHWRGWKILITGDAGFDTEKELLESGIELKCDVWIMGRHGSDYTGTMQFVQAVAPEIIVAGEARYPVEERVPDWWAEAIRKAGIVLWRQSETGAVMMDVEEGYLELRSFRRREQRILLEK